MPEIIPQSVTKRVVLKLYLSSDHISIATGKTLAIVISKNGATPFVNPSGGATNATEIANGWYYVDLTTTDTGTKGPLIVRGTSASCDDSEQEFTVASAHNAGFDGVPDVIAAGSGGLYTRGTGAGQINQTANGQIDVNIAAIVAGIINDAAFNSDADKYQADIWITRDAGTPEDIYDVVWFKNGQPITAGITSPTIQVIKSSDGSDLVASTAMTQIASTGLYRYIETTNRISTALGYIVKITASIGSATRTFYRVIGRDG